MISIVIPLYNKEDYIAKTIQSILTQTFQNFEIVIINDGSTDGSVKEVQRFEDKRIRLFEQTNAGVSAARNRGITEAQYEFIAFLDADDEWKPNYLTLQYDLIKSFPICDVFAMAYMVNRKGLLSLSRLSNLNFEGKGIIDYFCVAYQSDPPVWSSAVVVTKKALNQIGGFPLNVRSGEDLVTWAKLATLYKIAYSTEAASVYHVNEETWDQGRIPDPDDYVGIELSKLLTHKNNDTCLKKYIAYWYRIRSSMYIKHSRHIDALKEAAKAVACAPYCFKNYQYILLSVLPYSLVKSFLKFKTRYL